MKKKYFLNTFNIKESMETDILDSQNSSEMLTEHSLLSLQKIVSYLPLKNLIFKSHLKISSPKNKTI
jgi:hypothetical protein